MRDRRSDPRRASRAAGSVIDASTLDARRSTRGRRRDRRHRRRRRHRGGDPDARPGLSRAADRGRPAALVARLPDARSARPIPSSTRNRRRARRATRRSTSCRAAAWAAARRSTGRARSARHRRRSRTGSAHYGLAGVRRARRSRRGSRGWRSGSSIAPWTVAPNANNAALARGAAALGIVARRAIRRNVQGLLEPRLLRHGLPDQRQAVDAGHDDSGGARPRRDARHARARAALRDAPATA